MEKSIFSKHLADQTTEFFIFITNEYGLCKIHYSIIAVSYLSHNAQAIEKFDAEVDA